jgi:formate dehydrogenase
VPAEGLLDLLLRATRQPGFTELARHRHGLRRGEHRAGTFLGQRVVTDDGKVHLAPARLVERASTLEVEEARAHARRDRILLITKRHTKTHNSWTHNHVDMVKGDGGDTNHLYVHPDDAARLGLDAGALADVSTEVATVRVPVKLLEDLMPGTVALPHGWGHQHASGLSVASRTRGVNVNLLAAAGPDHVDPASGMSHLTGLPVEVAPARGPLDPRDWSGVPAAERGI